MGAKEKSLTNKRLSELGPHQRRFRINCGVGWVGQDPQFHTAGKTKYITLKNPRPLHAAPEGWPDLAGWDEITITPDMVGKKVAVFVGEEVKATGRLSKMQEKFRDVLVRMGGIFRVIRPD